MFWILCDRQLFRRSICDTAVGQRKDAIGICRNLGRVYEHIRGGVADASVQQSLDIVRVSLPHGLATKFPASSSSTSSGRSQYHRKSIETIFVVDHGYGHDNTQLTANGSDFLCIVHIKVLALSAPRTRRWLGRTECGNGGQLRGS